MNEQAKFTLILTNFTKTYAAVFYNSSIVFAFVEKQINKEFSKSIRKEIKDKKIPLLSRNNFVNMKWAEFADKYLSLKKEEVICENGKNYEIRYIDLEKIKLKPFQTHSTRSYEDGQVLGQIWFEAYSRKHHFNHKYLKQDEKVSQLRELFADKFVLLK